MKTRFLATLLSVALAAPSAWAARQTFHVEVQRRLSRTIAQTSNLTLNLTNLAYNLGHYKAGELSISANGPDYMMAAVWDTDQVFTTFTYGMGHWFNADGTPSARSTDNDRRVAVKFQNGQFYVTHRANTSSNTYTHEGEEFRFAELFVNGTDTVAYEFHITLVGDQATESMTCDQPDVAHSFAHRKDQTDSWTAMSLLRRNDEPYQHQNWIQVAQGDRITLSGEILDRDHYDSLWCRWDDPSGKRLRDYSPEPFVLTTQADPAQSGQYTLRARQYLRGSSSFITKSYTVYIDVQAHPGQPLSWEGLLPTFSYNFKDEYGEIPAPQNILGEVGTTDRYGKPVNRVNGEWWTAVWGSDLNTEVGTDTATVYQAARNMVKKYDTDFAFIRDVMGWPPDIRARKGYKSTVYIFGSGLRCDNTSNTEKGGYQSAIYYNDPKTGLAINWPCVWASYYPFSRFRSDADKIFSDGDYQREAMIHEGIHALFADMEGVKNSAWFHEAGNTWLQSAMAVRRSGTYGTPGFLDAPPFIAPFMPIECYSGWLQDGSFGGPSAEGVNMYGSDGKQICTWRNLLGGTQYGNSFPIVLSVMCGDGSIPWIWRNCKNRVLEGIGDYIGDDAMRLLITQYRARQALFDFGGWSKGYRQVMDNNFRGRIYPEWEPYNIDCGTWIATPYQRLRPNDAQGWLAPDPLVNPGWSGANIIPIHVEGDSVSVFFRPEDSQLHAILCYRTRSGQVFYSQVVRCGELRLPLTQQPANGVVFLVVCNTDYRYTGDAQRRKHWDYRIRLGRGALAVADQYQKWYMYEQTIHDQEFETGIPEAYTEAAPSDDLSDRIRLMTGQPMAGHDVRVQLLGLSPEDVSVSVVGLQGTVLHETPLSSEGTFRLLASLRHGLYLISFSCQGQRATYKVIVR